MLVDHQPIYLSSVEDKTSSCKIEDVKSRIEYIKENFFQDDNYAYTRHRYRLNPEHGESYAILNAQLEPLIIGARQFMDTDPEPFKEVVELWLSTNRLLISSCIGIEVGKKTARFNLDQWEAISEQEMYQHVLEKVILPCISRFDLDHQAKLTTYVQASIHGYFIKPRKQIWDMWRGQEISLDEESRSLGDTCSHDSIPDSTNESTDVIAERNITQEQLLESLPEFLELLKSTERRVFFMRHDLDNGRVEMSFEEIGRKLNFSKAYAHQVYKEVLRKLRDAYEKKFEDSEVIY